MTPSSWCEAAPCAACPGGRFFSVSLALRSLQLQPHTGLSSSGCVIPLRRDGYRDPAHLHERRRQGAAPDPGPGPPSARKLHHDARRQGARAASPPPTSQPGSPHAHVSASVSPSAAAEPRCPRPQLLPRALGVVDKVLSALRDSPNDAVVQHEGLRAFANIAGAASAEQLKARIVL